MKNKEIHLGYNQIDIGFTTNKVLTELYVTKKVSDRQVLDFRMEVKDCLEAVVYKILDKAPIKHLIVRNMKCLKLHVMTTNSQEAKKMFCRVLTSLNHAK